VVISQSSAKENVEQLKKEFPEDPIGITGCRSSGEPHPTCEYNYLIVHQGATRIERRISKNNFIELLFLDKNIVQNASDNKIMLALVDMNVISDPRWDLIPIVHKIKANRSKHLQQYAKNVLFKSLSYLGRSKDSIDRVNTLEAGFWLLCSANNFARATIALGNKVPHDTHLLNEFRSEIIKKPGMFDIWSDASGVNLATKVSVARRLEAFREILQVGRIFSYSLIFNDHINAYKFTEATSNYLVKSHAILDAHCYLGLEITKAIEELYEFKCRINDKPPLFHEMFSQLTVNSKPLKKISRQTILLMGINSEKQKIKKYNASLKHLIQKFVKAI